MLQLYLWRCFITLIIAKELVMADDDQCTDFQFKSPFLPGESCEGIYEKNPESQTKPGYYWILSREYCGMTYTGSSCEDICNNYRDTCNKPGYYRINDKWSYCNMKQSAFLATPDFSTTIVTPTHVLNISPTSSSSKLSSKVYPMPTVCDFIPTCAGIGGGWRRIANVDIKMGSDCPSGWRKDDYSGISFCRVVGEGKSGAGECSSAKFSTNGVRYQRVCGRARGYQKGWTAAFWAYGPRIATIDEYYGDGLLITYGNPRQHIWSYISGGYDNYTHSGLNCPCAVGGGADIPPFVGSDYYCESGAADMQNNTAYYFNDPLWDGSGCITSRCCENTTQPWFYRELNEKTASDIEARICAVGVYRERSVLIDQLELYIQ